MYPRSLKPPATPPAAPRRARAPQSPCAGPHPAALAPHPAGRRRHVRAPAENPPPARPPPATHRPRGATKESLRQRGQRVDTICGASAAICAPITSPAPARLTTGRAARERATGGGRARARVLPLPPRAGGADGPRALGRCGFGGESKRCAEEPSHSTKASRTNELARWIGWRDALMHLKEPSIPTTYANITSGRSITCDAHTQRTTANAAARDYLVCWGTGQTSRRREGMPSRRR